MPAVAQVVRSASLRGYVELAESLGLNAHAMLRRAGLVPRALDDPETPLSVSAVRQLLESSAQEAGVDDFGLRLASQRRLSNLGPISLVLREEPTGLQALESLCRYLRLLNASLLTRIEQGSELVIIREEFLIDHAAPTRQSMELAVGVMFRILRELLGPGWKPRRVCFSHRAPRDLATHRALLGPNVEFNCEFNGIVCARTDLEARLPGTDPDMARYARQYLDTALARNRANTSETVRQLIGALLPGGRCTADQVAQHLGVDRRTIHRHLATEGESFSGLLSSVRSEFAIRQIRDSDRSLAEVSELLGFSGPSAFAHWFRHVFGCSVSAWRKSQ
jgi:AraC-like DNA-binding protein